MRVRIFKPTLDAEEATETLNKMINDRYILVRKYDVHITPQVVSSGPSFENDCKVYITLVVEYEQL